MIIFRPGATIHHVEGGWYRANRHFSFDDSADPENTWFGDLRVFNDDTLVPAAAWPMHPHQDIEGVTYVVDGTFEHADSRGHGGVLAPGSLQRATLGSGMQHSERNHSATEPLRFIQMWIMPARRGLEPSIEQRTFSAEARLGRWLPVLVPAPGYGGDGAPSSPTAVTVHQDAAVFATLLAPEQGVTHVFRPGFQGYLFIVRGDAHVATDADAGELDEGGAAKVTGEREVMIRARAAGTEALLVETRAV